MNQSKYNRPWGNYIILDETSYYKVKLITINPKQRLSYQYHNKRSENWVILKGSLTVILDSKEILLNERQTIFIPQKAKHRAWNKTEDLIQFIEIQTGTYFGEDDIVRLHDDYKR